MDEIKLLKAKWRENGIYAFWFSSTTFQNQHWLYSGDSSIASASQARDLGVIFDFDSSVTIKPHISNVIHSSAFQLRNISRIRKYLSRYANEQTIHSFITSRLDNNNALLYGLPANELYRLQKIQNTAARILTFSRKSSHITPILEELHWLPVNQRMVFKLLMIAYKCINNIAPSYLSELLSQYSPTSSRNEVKPQLGRQIICNCSSSTLEWTTF